MRTKIKLYELLLVISLIIFVAVDQISKYIAVDRLMGKDSIVFIKGLLSFTYVENQGAAWGIMSGKVNVFVILTIIVIPLLIYFFIRTSIGKKYTNKKKAFSFLQFIEILLIAGAIGNFIDRIVNGYVVDFFQFTFIDFPVFNVADCYITVGAAMFIFFYFLLDDNDFDIILKGKKAVREDTKNNDEV